MSLPPTIGILSVLVVLRTDHDQISGLNIVKTYGGVWDWGNHGIRCGIWAEEDYGLNTDTYTNLGAAH